MPKTTTKSIKQKPVKQKEITEKVKKGSKEPLVEVEEILPEDILLEEVDETEIEQELPEELKPKKKPAKNSVIDYIPEFERGDFGDDEF